MSAEQPAAQPRWPYFGQPQRVLIFCGLAMFFGSILPWVIIRPFNFSASALARAWTLWAGLMAMAGGVARWRPLVLTSAVGAGGVAGYLAFWQGLRIFQDCAVRHIVRFRCVPGPGLLIVLAAGLVALWQAWRLRPESHRDGR